MKADVNSTADEQGNPGQRPALTIDEASEMHSELYDAMTLIQAARDVDLSQADDDAFVNRASREEALLAMADKKLRAQVAKLAAIV